MEFKKEAQVLITDWWWVNQGDDEWSIAGEVVNAGSLDAHMCTVTVTVFDNHGFRWTTEWDYTNPSYIESNRRAGFEVFLGFVPPEFTDVSLTVNWER